MTADSLRVTTCKPFGKPCSGYSAPDRKNSGIITKFMMSGNACMLCMRAPIAVPNAQHTTRDQCHREEEQRHRHERRRPKAGDRRTAMNTSRPWIIATVAPPSVRPIITHSRGTGATSVSFRKPNCRSQIRPMPENAPENSTVTRDDARREELQVAAVAGFRERRPEPVAEAHEIQQRLAERRDDLRGRAPPVLQRAKPENVDDVHRRLPHARAIWRI